LGRVARETREDMGFQLDAATIIQDDNPERPGLTDVALFLGASAHIAPPASPSEPCPSTDWNLGRR